MKTKSDAEILRDAKLEAMGLPPEDHDRQPHHDRPQMATDELVRMSILEETQRSHVTAGHGTIQEAYAQIAWTCIINPFLM